MSKRDFGQRIKLHKQVAESHDFRKEFPALVVFLDPYNKHQASFESSYLKSF